MLTEIFAICRASVPNEGDYLARQLVDLPDGRDAVPGSFWRERKGVPGTSVRLGISEEDLTSDNEWKNGSPIFRTVRSGYAV